MTDDMTYDIPQSSVKRLGILGTRAILLYLKFEWSPRKRDWCRMLEGVRNDVSYAGLRCLDCVLLRWRISTLGTRIIDGIEAEITFVSVICKNIRPSMDFILDFIHCDLLETTRLSRFTFGALQQAHLHEARSTTVVSHLRLGAISLHATSSAK